jgi:signal transduction histidine kinase
VTDAPALPAASARPSGTLPSRPLSALLGDPPFRLYLVGWALILAPLALAPLAGAPPAAYRNTWAFVLHAALVATICLLDLLRVRTPEARRLRVLVGVAFLVWAVDEALELVDWAAAAGSGNVVRDTLIVVFYVVFGFAALGELRAGESAEVRALRRLGRIEMAVFAVGLFLYFAILPIRLDPDHAASGLPAAVLFVTLDCLLLGLFGWRLRRARSPRDRRRWVLLVGAALLFALSDGIYALSVDRSWDIERFLWLDPLWFLPHLLVVAAVRSPEPSGNSSGTVRVGEPEVPALPIAPAFLYAALVPAVHLLSEIVGASGAGATRGQRLFALLLTLVLFAFAALHQVRLNAWHRALRREIGETRRQLAAAQKLEAIGRLAGGVAHDFNNLLTVVVGRTDLLLARAQGESERKNLETVLHAARRAADLTSELLAVGQRELGFRARIDLGELVEGMLPELRALCGAAIEVVTEPVDGALPIEVDPTHLERVARNLATNARDAMPAGGRLTIAAGRCEIGRGSVREEDEPPPGSYALLTFRDGGVGMDEATRRRLFEPFFTTKGLGRGTGLGLATVYGLVRQNGGSVRVASRPGAGTTFEVYFPLAS